MSAINVGDIVNVIMEFPQMFSFQGINDQTIMNCEVMSVPSEGDVLYSLEKDDNFFTINPSSSNFAGFEMVHKAND